MSASAESSIASPSATDDGAAAGGSEPPVLDKGSIMPTPVDHSAPAAEPAPEQEDSANIEVSSCPVVAEEFVGALQAVIGTEESANDVAANDTLEPPDAIRSSSTPGWTSVQPETGPSSAKLGPAHTVEPDEAQTPTFSDGDRSKWPEMTDTLYRTSDGEALYCKKLFISRLPSGYACVEHVQQKKDGSLRRDRYLFGHPSGKKFRSPNEFSPHLAHLLKLGQGGSSSCSCCVCASSQVGTPKAKRVGDGAKLDIPAKEAKLDTPAKKAKLDTPAKKVKLDTPAKKAKSAMPTLEKTAPLPASPPKPLRARLTPAKDQPQDAALTSAKRKRGRPRKSLPKSPDPPRDSTAEPKRGRGRPRKSIAAASTANPSPVAADNLSERVAPTTESLDSSGQHGDAKLPATLPQAAEVPMHRPHGWPVGLEMLQPAHSVSMGPVTEAMLASHHYATPHSYPGAPIIPPEPILSYRPIGVSPGVVGPVSHVWHGSPYLWAPAPFSQPYSQGQDPDGA